MTMTAPVERNDLRHPVATGPRPTALDRRRFFRTWTGLVAASEAVGFLFPAAAGVAVQSAPLAAGVVVILAAGALEGIFLGWAQQAVLRRALPGLHRGRWVALTAGAAVAAYALGYLLAFLVGVGSWVFIVPIIATAPLLLLTIGGAQTVELRRHVRRADEWITWTALAWLVGLAAFFAITTPLWHEGQAPLASVGVGVLGGAVMALLQAAVTGVGMLNLLVPPRRLPDPGDAR